MRSSTRLALPVYQPCCERFQAADAVSCHAQERFEDPDVVYVERAAAESSNGGVHAEAEHSGSEDGIAEHRGSANKVCCKP